MPSSVNHFILILQSFFPSPLQTKYAIGVLAKLASLFPIIQLHQNQRREPRQPHQTGWFKSAISIISDAFNAENLDPDELAYLVPEDIRGDVLAETWLARQILFDIEHVYDFLGIDGTTEGNVLFPPVAPVLITHRQDCIICPLDENHSLRRKNNPVPVQLLDSDYKWCKAHLFVAHCPRCRSDYYPDKYTFMNDDSREQKLEADAEYLHVSKSGVWVHKSIAHAQECAIFRYHCGWSNFANWINDLLDPAQPKFTTRQSQKLHLEHSARRLLLAHEKLAEFTCEANPSSAFFALRLCEVIGKDGGCIPSSLLHGCQECTHKKRYHGDIVAEEAPVQPNDNGVAGMGNINPELVAMIPQHPAGAEIPMPELLLQQLQPPLQEIRDGQPQGYVRMAVIDGKTIGHRICALDTCNKELTNYKNGRFCAEHDPSKLCCGIIPCGRPIATPASFTCDTPAHIEWHKKYLERFGRLSYPGVRRVIRRQQENGALPALQVNQNLPALNDIPGDEVVHTFRARSVYCLETVQWSCGIPIGWGKCYCSESMPQVAGLLDRIWEGKDDLRPSFVAFDDACDLLRHIVTRNRNDPWLKTTKFIVDAWHYIGHRTTDILCRLWCNPAPTNGSQPDLVVTVTDDNGVQHMAQAYNTETAEQLNAWLDGYESQLRQMSAVNYDLFVHYLMLLFKEDVENRIKKKELELPEEFWDEIE